MQQQSMQEQATLEARKFNKYFLKEQNTFLRKHFKN